MVEQHATINEHVLPLKLDPMSFIVVAGATLVKHSKKREEIDLLRSRLNCENPPSFLIHILSCEQNLYQSHEMHHPSHILFWLNLWQLIFLKDGPLVLSGSPLGHSREGGPTVDRWTSEVRLLHDFLVNIEKNDGPSPFLIGKLVGGLEHQFYFPIYWE